ncbi:hypothetical protein NMY22_g6010 [Coprinellus aureogranulatus]|nr:hypothetical protein NMY22_g6010 [Coprinellus aureogranulatus]
MIAASSSAPRYKDAAKKTPHKRYSYVPFGGRLASMLENEEFSKLMQYRAKEYPYDPEEDPDKVKATVKDIFDGRNFRTLQQKRVVVDGVEQPYRFFEQDTDVALGFSTDGFCPFRRRKKTCWPLLVFNYNLPPEIRFHLKWVLCIGVIPGPTKPKDCDSFLWPFVQECLRMALGVKAFSILHKKNIRLRAYPIVAFGDMPAVAMIMRMKGHNGILPCRWCKIKGVRCGKTYYVPLARAPPEKPYDPRNLPLRTHEQILSDGAKAEDLTVTKTEREARAKASGVKGVSILADIPSFIFPDGFPFDFMHLIFENLVPNLIELWSGEFKGMDHTGEAYVLDKSVWKAIGEATAKSGDTIPASFGARPKNFVKEKLSSTAETKSFWTLYLGPVLLRREFKDKAFYYHFVRLVKLLNLCLEYEYTREDVDTIREGFAKWVEDYEELYFKYDMERAPLCPLTIHALLHIADGIEASGPVWTYWAFPMERFCYRLRPYIKSMRYPWANLDNYVVLATQMDQIKQSYNLHREFAKLARASKPNQFVIDSNEYSECRELRVVPLAVLIPALPLHRSPYLPLSLALSRHVRLFATGTPTQGRDCVPPAVRHLEASPSHWIVQGVYYCVVPCIFAMTFPSRTSLVEGYVKRSTMVGIELPRLEVGVEQGRPTLSRFEFVELGSGLVLDELSL